MLIPLTIDHRIHLVQIIVVILQINSFSDTTEAVRKKNNISIKEYFLIAQSLNTLW